MMEMVGKGLERSKSWIVISMSQHVPVPPILKKGSCMSASVAGGCRGASIREAPVRVEVTFTTSFQCKGANFQKICAQWWWRHSFWHQASIRPCISETFPDRPKEWMPLGDTCLYMLHWTPLYRIWMHPSYWFFYTWYTWISFEKSKVPKPLDDF